MKRSSTQARPLPHTEKGDTQTSDTAGESPRPPLGLANAGPLDTTILLAIETVVRRVVDERTRKAEDRLSALLIKTLREAATGRWLAAVLIEQGYGRDVALRAGERAATAAGHILRARGVPLPEMEGSDE